jgi:two-component system chemotaxis response regulator CheB
VPIDLVAVGCSWGGLSAAERLLATLGVDFRPPTVIVQHRAESTSPLAELLTRHAGRPVREASDKDLVRPGHVYVAPAGYHLLVDRERFWLTTEGPVQYSRPSVDVLFESAAEAFGERLAAVVLTGANGDGARGLARVAELGGLTLVQDPATAEKPAMPRAALAAVPDAIVGDIEMLARVLTEAASEAGSELG